MVWTGKPASSDTRKGLFWALFFCSPYQPEKDWQDRYNYGSTLLSHYRDWFMTCRVTPGLLAGFLVLASSEVGTRFREACTRYIESNETDRTLSSMLWGTQIDAPYRQTLWQRAVGNAEKYSEPGQFTTFAGAS